MSELVLQNFPGNGNANGLEVFAWCFFYRRSSNDAQEHHGCSLLDRRAGSLTRRIRHVRQHRLERRDPSSAPITSARVTIHDPETGESAMGWRPSRDDMISWVRPPERTTSHPLKKTSRQSASTMFRASPAMRVGAVSELVRVWAQTGALQTETSEVRATSLATLWRTHPYARSTTSAVSTLSWSIAAR